VRKITAVIPVREGSKRVPNKNFKEFYNNKSLLEIKIEFLKEINLINDIVVNTDSNIAIDIAKNLGVNYFRRDDYYASSECSQSEFFSNLAETTDSDIILHSPCTSPMIKKQTIIDAINMFNNSENDSCNSVGLVKEYLWKDGLPLNYNIEEGEVPNSQDLPDIKKLTFGFNIINKETMLQRKNIVGNNPIFFNIDEIEQVDIDTNIDFEFAKFLYKKTQNE
jgi:CMP-N-acetylneuraminic acid synthetase